MLKQFCIKILSCYQYFISPYLGSTCRYYPSCSEYSKQIFLFQNPLVAVWKTLIRIFSCNQFFEGGVAYPQVSLKIQSHFSNPYLINIQYWLIPNKPQKYNFKNIPNGISLNLQIQKVFIIKQHSKASCA
ncbi:membrane protein insertion efficiency factor YidD [uncultured Helicobacter sp.]|uniref:membrane protein insertion efficiency factor YidD n=1 Tax=uncultured Helicobacter sp. TaxID=175537 RepID=UPI00262981F3|nr:membrane protein insertion efficiency factor YidD [uncultured Helicobacter sp.]